MKINAPLSADHPRQALRSSPGHIALVATLAICLLGITSMGASTATAQESSGAETESPASPASGEAPATSSASGTSLTFQQLGLGATISLTGTEASRMLTVPVPEGMDLQSLRGTFQPSSNTDGGTVEIRVDTAPVGSVDLGPAAGRTAIPFEVPLGGARSDTGTVRVELSTTLRSADGDLCGAAMRQPSVQLVGGSIGFGGVPIPPRTISEFLPPVLTELDIVVPQVFSSQQAEATLRLASDIALQYNTQRPAIEVHTEAPAPDPSWAFRRTIALAEGDPAMVVSDGPGGPTLVIKGDGTALAATTDLLTGQLSRLPVAETATIERAQVVNQELVQGRRTVASLGYGNLKTTGIGRLQIGVPFSQSDLGGPVESITAELSGTTTPIPDGAIGNIAVLLNDVVLNSQALDGSGSFDLTVPLPNSQLRRDNDLILEVSYTPPGGLCQTGAQPITIQLSPDSLLQGVRGSSLPPGFNRFPQALLPTFTVALATLDGSSLDIASKLVVSLQQASGRLLRPQVHAWATAVSESAPTLFVGQENVDFDATLRPPIELAAGRQVQATTDSAQLQIGGQVAALEAFTVGGRDILLGTWQEDQNLLTRLVDDVVSEPNGWRALTGDVVVQGPVGEPEMLAVRAPEPGTTIDQAPQAGLLSSRTLLLVGALLILIALIGVVAWAWYRRRHPIDHDDDDPTASLDQQPDGHPDPWYPQPAAPQPPAEPVDPHGTTPTEGKAKVTSKKKGKGKETKEQGG